MTSFGVTQTQKRSRRCLYGCLLFLDLRDLLPVVQLLYKSYHLIFTRSMIRRSRYRQTALISYWPSQDIRGSLSCRSTKALDTRGYARTWPVRDEGDTNTLQLGLFQVPRYSFSGVDCSTYGGKRPGEVILHKMYVVDDMAQK